jgi:hypothetical protein
MRTIIAATAVFAAMMATITLSNPGSAAACAGLIGSNGAVNLGRTTTLAAYHDGTEHYVTSFEFQGGGGEFGTLIPLPGVPTTVERGGDWTLQRLQIETAPPIQESSDGDTLFAQASASRVQVLQEVKIDALDIKVLSGGGGDVALWAEEHGFRLSPDAPEVLDFYAQRSPIFLAAVFDGEAAADRGQALGDGTPVHITIPTENPWVPLRILGLGKQAEDFVQADVFLLTDRQPSLLPVLDPGLNRTHSAPATDLLLADLRSDAGMDWMPTSAWLTKIEVNSSAADLHYDLAIDASGQGNPSRIAAGLDIVPNVPPITPPDGSSFPTALLWLGALAAIIAAVAARGRFVIGARK